MRQSYDPRRLRSGPRSRAQTRPTPAVVPRRLLRRLLGAIGVTVALLGLVLAGIAARDDTPRPTGSAPTATTQPQTIPTVAPTPSGRGGGAVITPPALATTSAPAAGAIPILMYHYIRPDPGPDDPVGQGLSVSPENFDAQMAYLADAGYTPITMAALADIWAGRLSPPARPVVLTFDDGYEDFYTAAWPILRAYGFSATVYVVSGLLDRPGYLTSDMVAELAASGLVDFGSHTLSHADLPTLSHRDAAAEIVESKQALEQLLGHPVRTFCYPAGHYKARDRALVAQAGYELAVTTASGVAAPTDDPLLLPRLRVNGWTTVEELAGWL